MTKELSKRIVPTIINFCVKEQKKVSVSHKMGEKGEYMWEGSCGGKMLACNVKF